MSQVLRQLDRSYSEDLHQRWEGGSQGPTLVTTIDTDLQEAADLAFDSGTAHLVGDGGPFRGAVVLLDARTGDILALVNRPAFDPDELVDVAVWAAAEGTDRRGGFDSRYLNRAVHGLYPPGSTFKTITAAGAIDHGLHRVGHDDFDYNEGPSGPQDPGFGQGGRWHQLPLVDGPPITGGNHPHVEDWTFDITEAFAYSCNIAFAEMGIELGAERLVEISRRFGFERPIEVPGLGTTISTLDTAAEAELAERPLAQTDDQLARTAFGQGELLASPLHMAMVAAAVANDGVIMQPRIVAGLRDQRGDWIVEAPTDVFIDTELAPETVAGMQVLFDAAVDFGTAEEAAVPEDRGGVGGKTGTAEWGGGEAAPHAWFIADYPSADPRLALAVLVEEGGAGGDAAARVAADLLGSDAVAAFLGSLDPIR